MSNKLIFQKPNIWRVLTILTLVVVLLILLIGFWLTVFKLSNTVNFDSMVWIPGIIFSFLILFCLVLIVKEFLNQEYLIISTDNLQLKINDKTSEIPLTNVDSINFRVKRISNTNNMKYHYDLVITTLDKKVLLVSNIVISFWNFQEVYNEITEFVARNNLKLKVIRNFDDKMIAFKQNLAKVVLVCVWFFIIWVLIVGKN